MIHGDILGERARITPDRTALVEVETSRRLSYGELDRRATRCALALTRTLGLNAGDRVAILAHNRVEYVETFFAAARSGITLVPLGHRLTAPELEYMLRDSGARALLHDGAVVQTREALGSRIELEHWIAMDAPGPDDHSYDALLDQQPDEPWTAPRPDPEQILCLIYTSGTTGQPKGVMLPHRQFAWNAYNTVVNWQLRDDDVTSVFTPMYHAAGMSVFLAPLFLVGARVVLHREFDAQVVLRTMEAERCTVVLGVPTIFKMLLEHPALEQVDLRQVRWFISGGAPLPTYLVQAYAARGVPLKQGFGMTEVGVNCFTMSVEEATTAQGSIGRPMMFTEARLCDAGGRPTPSGEVGELQLRGPHVSQGYWMRPEATAAALDADGWFHTGDLARQDAHGMYHVAGRDKDMFISGGVNVYPAEIESALLLHPAVEDVAVVGLPHETWGEVGHAFVVLRAGQQVEPSQLADHLAARLARFKLPRSFHVVEQLPRTPYGKVQKHLLVQQLDQQQLDQH